MLAQGKVQAIFGFSFSSVLNLKSQGVPADDISLILMAENGLDLYGNSILVSNEFAAKNPNAVKGFLKAVVKGMRDTAKDPGAAVESVLKRNSVVTKPVELERLQMALAQNFVTPAVKKNGFGGVEADKLARNIADAEGSAQPEEPAGPRRRVRRVVPATGRRAQGRLKAASRRSGSSAEHVTGARPSIHSDTAANVWVAPAASDTRAADRPTSRAYRARRARSMPGGFVEVADVSLTYGGAGGTLAVDGLNMTVEEGQFAAVVGPSGCGKSTLMKLTTGLVRPSKGSVMVAGKPVERAGFDGRHGVPEPVAAAVAHDA